MEFALSGGKTTTFNQTCLNQFYGIFDSSYDNDNSFFDQCEESTIECEF